MLFSLDEGGEKKEINCSQEQLRKAQSGNHFQVRHLNKEDGVSLSLQGGMLPARHRAQIRESICYTGLWRPIHPLSTSRSFPAFRKAAAQARFWGWRVEGGHQAHLRSSRCLYQCLQIAPRKGELQGKGNQEKKNALPFKGIKTRRRTGQGLFNNGTANAWGQNPKSRKKRHRQRGM